MRMIAIRAVAIACVWLGCCEARAAQPYQEYRKHIESAQTLTALTDGLMGDSVSLFNGATEFAATDINLPGNNALPVQLRRRFSIEITPSGAPGSAAGDPAYRGAGNWDIEVPYISTTFGSGAWPNARCSSMTPPSAPAGLDATDLWQGNSVHVPGEAGRKMLFMTSTSIPHPSDGVSRPWTTRERDMFSCIPMQSGLAGEGFLMQTTSGLKYYFDRATTRYAGTLYYQPGVSFSPVSVSRTRYYLLASKVVDRFGNRVDFSYDADGHPVSITSSDGRAIALTYSGGRLVSATVHDSLANVDRTWQYAYGATGDNAGMLTQVTQPDGSRWQYAHQGTLFPDDGGVWDGNADSSCNNAPPPVAADFVLTVTHPSGAVGTFQLGNRRHPRSGVHMNACLDRLMDQGGTSTHVYKLLIPTYFDVMSLNQKTLSGPGMSSMTWSYQYPSGMKGALWGTRGSPDAYPCSTCATEKVVTVAQPDGTSRQYRYGYLYALNEGRLLGTTTLDALGNIVRIESTEYLSEASAAGQAFHPLYGSAYGGDEPSSLAVRPIVSQTLQQDGATFTMQVESGAACGGTGVYCFDLYGNPTRVRRYSSLGSTRTDATVYQHDTTAWILGLVQSKTNIDTGMTTENTDYDARSLPWRVYAFGKLQQTLTYNTDGTVATVADGGGNTTTVSNWKRGVPRTIQYPPTPESPSGATTSAIVDDNGWITSVTDENGYITGYGYDAMGRLASVVYPTGDTLTGGTSAYHASWANYRALTSADWKPAGVSDGQWRKLEGTGNHIAVTYYDAMWRPVLTNEYDQNNVTPTLRAVRTEYDTSGRKSFESYPSSSGVPGATGIRSYYDALDRVRRVEQDSELGVLATTTEYLAGLKTRVTNPRGKQTTTSFTAWDQPGYDLPILSEQPEGKVIQITRHPQFGWPLSMTQRNAANTLSQTRKYVYDGNGQLCKTIEPETGATVMGYDAAGNPSWSAAGLDANAYAPTTDCQHAAAYASGRVSTRTYDARNRLSVLDFPDHRGKQVWAYAPDGKPASITVYNTANDPQPVITAYNYNHRRLLTGETLTQQNWYSWTMGYAYDAYGNLASQTYPTGLTVAYAPNPLGQATQAGSYATGAQYYPNGALKQFTYGNGIVHTMTQNARQLPSQVTSSGTTNYTYNYDADGNITNIWDLARGDNYSRWMTYDDLDRLTSAGSASFGGDAWHRFTYDALDNLSSWKLAGVKDYAEYVYNTQNLLTNIRNTAGASVVGLGYDLQGNVNNKNGQTYDFDYGNRLCTVTGKESYRYDGLGRRVQSTATDGSKTTTWQYTQSGQMAFSSDWVAPGQSNQKTHENVYLAGSVVAIIDHDWPSNAVIATKYQHTDALGSPVAVTNAAGTVIERNDYEPYGAVIGKPAYSGIGYTGHVMDGGTGLTYMQQRYYDPVLGRFLSSDAVTAYSNPADAFNRYWYAFNSPYRFTDPDGRSPAEDDPDRQPRGAMRATTISPEANRINYAKGGAPTAQLTMQMKSGNQAERLEAAKAAMAISQIRGDPNNLSYNADLDGKASAVTDPAGYVEVGPDAFVSWSWLASTLGHEYEIHVPQFASLGPLQGQQDSDRREVEAHQYNLDNAQRFRNTPAEVQRHLELRDAYQYRLEHGK